jgi:DNA (cytosine-5)-methyltransferase 1
MEHLGDITKLDGGKIPPVDVICFGSPCQSYTVKHVIPQNKTEPAK